MENQETLELLLVAQTLTLAKTMKMEMKLKGTSSTSNFYREAAREIASQRSAILQLLFEEYHR